MNWILFTQVCMLVILVTICLSFIIQSWRKP